MVPSGYERLLVGHAVAIARADAVPGIRRALIGADGTRSTLHEYASRQIGARALAGRRPAYAIALPESTLRVVVRHNQHGGAFRALTRDRFFSPTRAPYELTVSLELRKLGVPTPDVVAYVLYPPGQLLQRCDVASREIPDGRDLAGILMSDGQTERAAALAATARLVASLSGVGARHHDLNAKNVLVTLDAAYILDVDRMTLGGSAEDALRGNLARLSRSLRRWRDRFGARITEDDISDLAAVARGAGD
ncbi:MAG: lipopolysaccharide kinase InaA family protein [Gemmatimonadaceae bacterium]